MPNCQYYSKEKTLPLNSQIPFLLFHLHCSFPSMIYRFYVSSLQKATVIPNEKRTDKSTIYTCLSGARKCSTHAITLHRVELNSNDSTIPCIEQLLELPFSVLSITLSALYQKLKNMERTFTVR